MSKSGAANHIHRYKKVNLSRSGKEYPVYKCIKPACSHYVPVALSEGKLCECHRCGDLMVINRLVLTGSAGKAMTKPHCANCVERKGKDTKDVAAISAFLAGNKT